MDLTCKVRAVRSGGAEIPNNSQITAQVGESVSIEFWAKNDSGATSKFFWTAHVTRNGEKVPSQIRPGPVSLKPKQEKLIGTQKVVLTSNENYVESLMGVDAFNLVAETNEHNNVARHKFSSPRI